MPYINETPSEEDIVKYKLREQDKEYGQSGRDIVWTRDKERDSYLRRMRTDGRWEPIVHEFVFYWGGRAITLNLELVSIESERGKYLNEVLKIHKSYLPNGSFWLPTDLEPMRTQIIADYKEALITRNGIYVVNNNDAYEKCVWDLQF